MPTELMKRMFLSALALTFSVAMLLPAVTSASWPIASRTSYVSQRFHDGHRGMDLAARSGSSVYPISPGRVVFAGYKRNCGGYQVWIKHRSGKYSAYYHLKLEVTHRGDWVTRRERIGYVGATGCATGPHVHFEMWTGYPWRTGSHRVNPWRWLDSGSRLPARYR